MSTILDHPLVRSMADQLAAYRAECASLTKRLQAAEADADRWYWVARNPAAEREQVGATLAMIDAAAGRERDERRRATLDRLQREDPTEYHRVIWLRLAGHQADADAALGVVAA